MGSNGKGQFYTQWDDDSFIWVSLNASDRKPFVIPIILFFHPIHQSKTVGISFCQRWSICHYCEHCCKFSIKY